MHKLVQGDCSQRFCSWCTARTLKPLPYFRGGRNRIGRGEKWPKQSREEGEKEKLTFREEGEIGSKSREEGEIGSESREKGDLPPPPCSTPLILNNLD